MSSDIYGLPAFIFFCAFSLIRASVVIIKPATYRFGVLQGQAYHFRGIDNPGGHKAFIISRLGIETAVILAIKHLAQLCNFVILIVQDFCQY